MLKYFIGFPSFQTQASRLSRYPPSDSELCVAKWLQRCAVGRRPL